MKGIVFNLLEAIVTRDHGADTWDALLDSTGLEGVYTSLGSYPDAELMAIVAAASSATGQPPADIVRWFGREALPLLVEKYPAFFTKHRQTRPFLLSLNDIIHPEVRKLYPGAETPEFEFDSSSPDVLVMGYQSPRRLCAFAEGLIDGAAAHFGEAVTMAHPKCMHRGDPGCRLELTFTPRTGMA